jgi:hypothetical protein
MNPSSRLLAGCIAVVAALATGSLAPAPAEAHWRPYWRPGIPYPGFYRPAFFPRPLFYPPPIIYPRPVVYAPVYVPPPPVYATYAPPRVAYAKPYRKRVTYQQHRKASRRPACNCPAQPPTAPAPAVQPPSKGS